MIAASARAAVKLAREIAQIVPLPPGGRWECQWSLEVHDSREGVAAVLREVAGLQAHVRSVIHRTPQPRFSSQV